MKRTLLIREHENSQEGPKSSLGDVQQRPRVRRNETQRKFNMQEQSESVTEKEEGVGVVGFRADDLVFDETWKASRTTTFHAVG